MIALQDSIQNNSGTHMSSPNERYEEFVELISADPKLPREELAKHLNVTRQTIQVWLRRYKANRPMTRRGRPNKFGSIPSQTYTFRLPGDLVEKLSELFPGASKKEVSRQVRSIIDDGMADLVARFIETTKSQTAAKPNNSDKMSTRITNKAR